MKHVLTLLFALMLALPLAAPVAADTLGDDGLHKEPWLRDTFKDLPDDLAEANSEGKRLLLMFEQRGCIYCAKMHKEVFSRPEIAKYITDNYFVVQLNLHGGTEMTDFDGETLTEKAAARKWGILFTPTLMFVSDAPEAGVAVPQASVAVMPGAFGAGTTLDMLTWVNERRYLDQDSEDFQRYHARRIKERSNGKTD